MKTCSNLIFFSDLGGEIILPKTAHENELVNNITKPFHKVCEVEDEGGKAVWLRVVSDKKGRWNDPITGSHPQYSNWRRGKTAETDDNCAFMLSGDSDKDGKWSSGTCTEQSPRYILVLVHITLKKLNYPKLI